MLELRVKYSMTKLEDVTQGQTSQMFLHREPLCGSPGYFSTAAAAAVHCCCVKTGSKGQMGQGRAM